MNNIQRATNSSDKSELSELKEMNSQWSGEKVALQTRLSQQEQVILALKFKLLQYEIANKSKTQEELDVVMEDHKKQIQHLHGQLATRNDIIHRQREELDELKEELSSKSELESTLQAKLEVQEEKVAGLQKQLSELTERFRSSSPSRENSRLSEGSRFSGNSRLSECSRISSRLHSPRVSEKAESENGMSEMKNDEENKFQASHDTQKVLREHKSMCTILSNMRHKLKMDGGGDEAQRPNGEHPPNCGEDNGSHRLTLPKSIEQIRNSRMGMNLNKQIEQDNNNNNNRNTSNNRILTIPRPLLQLPGCHPNVNIARSTCSVDSGYDHRLPSDPGERLKVIYYLGKSMTPVLKISDIGLGSFTLGDFKNAVNRPGKFRYFFKSVDSDFGYVREELLFDEDIVPGHDNKVVAWLERNMSDL